MSAKSKAEKVLPPPHCQIAEIGMMVAALNLQKPDSFTVDDFDRIKELGFDLAELGMKVIAALMKKERKRAT